MTTPTHTHTQRDICVKILPHVAGNVLARLNGSIVLISLSWHFVCPSPRRARVVMLPGCSSCSCPCGYPWLAVTPSLIPPTHLQRVPYVCCFGQCGSNFDTFKRRRRRDQRPPAPLRFVPACMPSRHYFAQLEVLLPSSCLTDNV